MTGDHEWGVNRLDWLHKNLYQVACACPRNARDRLITPISGREEELPDRNACNCGAEGVRH
jgi:hypothetical protein